MKNKLIELIHECEVEALKSNLHLSPERIADYLLEKGVVVLPCKIGATLYDVTEFFDETKYPEIYELKDNAMFIEICPSGKIVYGYEDATILFEEIGKNFFSTREEAEKTIAEGRGI